MDIIQDKSKLDAKTLGEYLSDITSISRPQQIKYQIEKAFDEIVSVAEECAYKGLQGMTYEIENKGDILAEEVANGLVERLTEQKISVSKTYSSPFYRLKISWGSTSSVEY